MQGSPPSYTSNQKKNKYEKPMITIEVYESYKKKYCSKQEQMHARQCPQRHWLVDDKDKEEMQEQERQQRRQREERIRNKTIRSKVLTHRVSTTHLLNRQIMSVFCYSNSVSSHSLWGCFRQNSHAHFCGCPPFLAFACKNGRHKHCWVSGQ